MAGLPLLGNLSADLGALLQAPVEEGQSLPLIEGVAAQIAEALRAQGLSARQGDYLEPYAYDIGEHIRDSALRNSPVML